MTLNLFHLFNNHRRKKNCFQPLVQRNQTHKWQYLNSSSLKNKSNIYDIKNYIIKLLSHLSFKIYKCGIINLIIILEFSLPSTMLSMVYINYIQNYFLLITCTNLIKHDQEGLGKTPWFHQKRHYHGLYNIMYVVRLI